MSKTPVRTQAVRFFDYPEAPQLPPAHTFLDGASDGDWKTLLRYTGAEPFVLEQILLKEGDPGDAFFILVEGRVQVLSPTPFGQRTVATIEPGSVFGEIAFLDGGTRSATVRAMSDGALIRVSREAFAKLQKWEPQLAQRIALDLARICAGRLRQTLRLIGR
jgi:CRP-like cAMP-binding protein